MLKKLQRYQQQLNNYLQKKADQQVINAAY